MRKIATFVSLALFAIAGCTEPDQCVEACRRMGATSAKVAPYGGNCLCEFSFKDGGR